MDNIDFSKFSFQVQDERAGSKSPALVKEPAQFYSESIKLSKQAYVKKLYTDKLKFLTELDRLEQLEKELGEDTIDLLKEVESLRNECETGISPSEHYGYFITINPVFEGKDKKEVLRMLIKTSKKIAAKAGIQKAIWCFEQTGEGETLGEHPHLHMLAKRYKGNRNGEPSRLKKAIKDNIKKAFPDMKNYQIKNIKDGNENGCIKYVLGNKNKEYNNEFDKEWRKMNNLKDYYEK